MTIAALSNLKESISERFGRLTPRDRKMLIGLGMIVPLILVWPAYMARQSALEANVQARTDLATAERQAGRGGATLESEIQRQQADVEAWSWHAPSAPVGRVVVQDEISGLTLRAGMTESEVRVGERIEQAGQVYLVKVDVTAAFDWNSLGAFLAGMRNFGKGFLIDSINLVDDQNPKVRISMRLPVVVVEDEVLPEETNA